MKRSPSHYTTIPKSDKIPHKKNRTLLVHIVELSTALEKVDTKVINGSLSKSFNQCLQCVPLDSTHAEILRPRDATELNNDE